MVERQTLLVFGYGATFGSHSIRTGQLIVMRPVVLESLNCMLLNATILVSLTRGGPKLEGDFQGFARKVHNSQLDTTFGGRNL